jgi:hypothetical protein
MPVRHTRFPQDSDQVAFIGFNINEYVQDLAALIINESSQGACFVVNKALIPKSKPIVLGQVFLAKVGKMDPLKAKVRWINDVDVNLLKIGIELLE